MSPMFIAAMLAIFAVSLVGFSMLIGHDTGGAVSHGDGGLFKTGNPSLSGSSATLGMRGADIEVPATLEADRVGVES
ncbi:hypothetical protein [Enhygromyxa salina]|uniref:Uncharacterized protein n=1 Tax=Enhygromyxa salina TaxID=215803 RepID=A0A2S9YC74_9BACT|nr:hypothetical protein [Enhygromyxa salina]PRQ02695.1 hypothetical protein ENSA7_55240 [Enhygromyxa salina]